MGARCAVLTGHIAALLLAGAAMAQPAPECQQAKTAAEKAICGNPELAAADQRMAQAYAALRSQLPAEQKAGLLGDQRRWVRERDGRCADKADRELTACLLGETERRRRFLEGEGTADAGYLRPAFFHEAKAGRHEISIEYPQFAPARGAAQTAFNRAAHAIAFGKDAASEYRAMEPPHAAGAENFYEVDYAVSHLDRRLASVVFTIFTFTGGAHPNTARAALLFDLAAGRSLRLPDLLAEPKQAVAELSVQCKTQLAAEGAKNGWELFDNADVAAVVGDINNWGATKDGIEILFDPYAVAPYVAGLHECRLPYGTLAQWLKPGGLLPPQ